jgi:hypothetical protein
MKARMLSSIVMGLAIGVLFTAQASSEEQPQMSKEMQEQLAKMKEFGTPGAEHAILKTFEGNWNVSSRSWMKPGDKEQQSTGTSSMTWVLGGRFLRQDYKGDWGGQTFEGFGFVGYDKMKKEYVSVWLDNVSTSIFHSSGQYDAATKTIKDSGTFSCPMTGKKDEWFRAEWKIVSNDEHVYSMFMKDPEGKEFKMMEMTYKRAI